MGVKNELVKEFQLLHLKRFGKPIDFEVAKNELLGLANLVRITAPVEDVKNGK